MQPVRTAILEFLVHYTSANAGELHFCLQMLVWTLVPVPGALPPDDVQQGWVAPSDFLALQDDVIATIERVCATAWLAACGARREY